MKYTIKYGDTLWALAQRHNTTVASLVSANNIADPDKIREGQVIEVPLISPEMRETGNRFVAWLKRNIW